MATTTVKTPLFYRLMGAAVLDTAVFEEVEADRGATAQAFAIVLLASCAAGVGASGLNGYTLGSIATMGVAALLMWAAWAVLTFEIGSRLMPESTTHADVGELLRTIGFATTPGLLLAAGALPGSTIAVFVVSGIWMMAAGVVAIRQALDYSSTVRAIGVCATAGLLASAMAIGLGMLFGPSVS